MLRMLVPIAALLLSDALLLVGHGIQVTLLPLRAEVEGFSPTEVALTGSAYFIGYVVGCLVAPKIIRRVGHIRSFAVLSALFACAALLFHGFPVFSAWLGFRFLVGACISGLYMIIESWLNDSADRASRGTVLSVYVMINLLMIVVGQQLLNLAAPSAGTLYGLAAIFLCLSIIPVSLTLALTPAPLQTVSLDFSRVWALSHIGISGAVASGLVTGAFWSLGPVFARKAGMETSQLTLFMSSVVVGGALLQVPLGKLSDKLDRRLVLLGTSLVGALISALISLFYMNYALLPLLALAWGGMVMTMYAICLAHAADNAEPAEFVMVGSCILLLFGSSSALGAPLASWLMGVMGPAGLFVYSAICLILFAVVIAVRRQQHMLPVLDETEAFRAMTDTSPAAFVMDPRTEDLSPRQPASWEYDSPADVPVAGEGANQEQSDR